MMYLALLIGIVVGMAIEGLRKGMAEEKRMDDLLAEIQKKERETLLK